jgi:hypothetical protein
MHSFPFDEILEPQTPSFDDSNWGGISNAILSPSLPECNRQQRPWGIPAQPASAPSAARRIGNLKPLYRRAPSATRLRQHPAAARRSSAPQGVARLYVAWTGGSGWVTVERQGFTRDEGLGAAVEESLEGAALDVFLHTKLITKRHPEAAQQLLDPAIHIMMDAVHRFEGTVNQVLGDGIMALFGAPIAHEDHAARACYAALAMQAAMQPYAEQVRSAHGIEMQIRVGLNSGEVVVRTIGTDLHMDYSAVGPTTHLAARMEQLARPGSTRLSASTLRLVEGLVQVNDLGQGHDTTRRGL